MNKKTLYIIIAAILLIAIIIGFKKCSNKTIVSFETEKAKMGTVVNTVTATGTIQATKTVQVGTQVSGVINKIYVDFNSHVKKGQLLAEVDKKTLNAQLESAQATLDRTKSDADYQSKNYERIKVLFDKGLIAQTDFDNATNTFKQAKAALKTAQSDYNKAKTNLSFADIYSPIDGIVLNRAVDEGQTVAASFNTPTLFTIAQDLTQMRVEANIDEADIGLVKLQQKVKFTVDAFPDESFNGEVTEIRLQPTTISNVVTYTVIIKAPNPESKLMPGMTANISILADEANNALLVPSKALRFTPDSSLMVKYFESLPEDQRPNLSDINAKRTAAKVNKLLQKSAKVWVKDGAKVFPVPVTIGLNDETNVQIISGLKLGQEVIISMSSTGNSDAAKTAAKSPFMPTRPGKK
jgi:HlyD family secretion protein